MSFHFIELFHALQSQWCKWAKKWENSLNFTGVPLSHRLRFQIGRLFTSFNSCCGEIMQMLPSTSGILPKKQHRWLLRVVTRKKLQHVPSASSRTLQHIGRKSSRDCVDTRERAKQVKIEHHKKVFLMVRRCRWKPWEARQSAHHCGRTREGGKREKKKLSDDFLEPLGITFLFAAQMRAQWVA